MQVHGDPEIEASDAEVFTPTPRKRHRSVTRKVTVRLTEKVHEQLEAATDRPGVGKSMVVEAALSHFMAPQASFESKPQNNLDDIHARFDTLEHDLRVIAETVALHARYHLTTMPPLPQQQQQAACELGDQRFKALAEQVDRRVRLGRPLMQETIDRLGAATFDQPEPMLGDGEAGLEPTQVQPEPDVSGSSDSDDRLRAAAQEVGSDTNFRHLQNSFR